MRKPLLRKSQFLTADSSTPVFKMALKLATLYRTYVKAETVFKNPFKPGLPIENQSVFTHFLKAAEIVIEEDGDARMFIKSQFDGLRWARTFPFPPQLHTVNARLRFMQYRMKNEDKESQKVTDDDFLIDEFEIQERKLKKLMASTGERRPKVLLKVYRKNFTKAFLRSQGVSP